MPTVWIPGAAWRAFTKAHREPRRLRTKTHGAGESVLVEATEELLDRLERKHKNAHGNERRVLAVAAKRTRQALDVPVGEGLAALFHPMVMEIRRRREQGHPDHKILGVRYYGAIRWVPALIAPPRSSGYSCHEDELASPEYFTRYKAGGLQQ